MSSLATSLVLHVAVLAHQSMLLGVGGVAMAAGRNVAEEAQRTRSSVRVQKPTTVLMKSRRYTQSDKGRKEYVMELRNVNNMQYIGDINLGGQTLPVIYDTGSWELIVLSKLCHHCTSKSPVYDQRLSQTFGVGDAHRARHVFGSGDVLGQHGLETIHLGNATSPFSAAAVAFWQVVDHKIENWQGDNAFSGIVGLGTNAYTPNMGQSGEEVFSSDQSVLEAVGVNAFGICLQHGPGAPSGQLMLGPSIESAANSDTFVHLPVIGQFHWAVQMTNLDAHGSGKDVCEPSCAAIVDSGTSLIGAPSAALIALKPLFAQIREDCSNVGELPDITFHLGGQRFSLPPALYVLRRQALVEVPAQTPWDTIWGPADSQKVTRCVPAFFRFDVDAESHGSTWILGMPFLRAYYTVFQRKPAQLHIAKATESCFPEPPSAENFNVAGPRVFSNSSVQSKRQDRHVKSADFSKLRVPAWSKGGITRKIRL